MLRVFVERLGARSRHPRRPAMRAPRIPAASGRLPSSFGSPRATFDTLAKCARRDSTAASSISPNTRSSTRSSHAPPAPIWPSLCDDPLVIGEHRSPRPAPAAAPRSAMLPSAQDGPRSRRCQTARWRANRPPMVFRDPPESAQMVRSLQAPAPAHNARRGSHPSPPSGANSCIEWLCRRIRGAGVRIAVFATPPGGAIGDRARRASTRRLTSRMRGPIRRGIALQSAGRAVLASARSTDRLAWLGAWSCAC